MKHTAGPWETDKYGSYIWADDEKGRFPVAQTRGWGHLTGAGGLALREEAAVEIQKANARLIAKAPELLAACEFAMKVIEHGDFKNGVTDGTGTIDEGEVRVSQFYEELRQLVAKAKGEAE